MQSSTDSPWKLAIEDIRCDGLQQLEQGSSKSKSSRQYYLVLSIRGTKTKLKTDSARGSDSSTWKDVFYFDISHPKSALHIEVYAKHRLRRDELISQVDVDISSSVIPQRSEKISIMIPISSKSSSGTSASITLTLYEITTGNAIAEANKAMESMEDAPRILSGIHKGPDATTTSEASLQPFAALVENLGTFVTLVDKLAEIHPYAKCAWSVLSAAYKILQAQKDLDDSVKDLVNVLDDAYEFVTKATYLDLKEDQHRQLVAKRLGQQTVECAWFIHRYARDPGFWKRTMKHSLDGSNKLINDLKQNITSLKEQFLGSSTVHTELVVVRMEVKIDDLKDKIDGLGNKIDNSNSRAILDTMAYASARCSSEKACLLGTRVSILDEITAWINSDGENVERVFWLTGVAGSGKSAIAHTIAHTFQQINRGSSFSFDASKPTQSQAKFLYTTLSRDMADLDLGWRASLVNILAKSKALGVTSSVTEQFQRLFLEPCGKMSTFGPIVLVIDALDECCDESDVRTPSARTQLLKILSTEAAKLPSNFHILLTSRREDDIHRALNGKPHVRTQNMEEIENTKEDIEQFVRDRLGNVEQLKAKLPNEWWLQPLVERSENLFQWAFTACSFIAGKDARNGSQPIHNWKAVLTSTKLDGLYRTILDHIFGFKEDDLSDDVLCRYRKILGRVLDVRQPLPLNVLNKLGIDDEPEDDASVIIKPLGSLLRGALETDTPIQPLHTSFREFLTDKKRSGVYSVSAGSQDTNLTLACLRVMQRDLRFNICGLETSHKRNSEVANLESRVKEHIPTHLRYACHFWAYHLQDVAEAEVVTELRDFLSRQLLFWMEVMSLTKGITSASRQMSLLSVWVQTTDSEFVNIANEVTRFIDMSAGVVVEHTPHLYISILPFVPVSSMIATQYLHRFPRRIVVQHRTMTSWPSTALELLAHRYAVHSVAFSPNGERIVSGSRDTTIRVWDAYTGEIAAGPFEGHTDSVSSVAFSPDGKLIVSGCNDNTIYVWDACTGEVAAGPFEGHTDSVTSVAFSPEGARIVSGSWDNTIRIWDVRIGKVAGGPLRGHTSVVSSVAFSPDGERIVSGSYDNTVYVWDVRTGEIAAGPFEGHTDCVSSVAFSPEGARIVSGSWDRTIRVWDVHSGEVVAGPFEGHVNSVWSVAFSPGGERIVSGSHDDTIYVWDAHTGKVVAGPFEGHVNSVSSVAFSPDGERVVSGSWDHTIRLWDARAGEFAAGLFEGHTNSVLSVAFSPEGERIVSGSADTTIRIWDARTGEVARGLFEGHTSMVSSVAFSPNGERIVSGSNDSTICVWDARTGEVAGGLFEGHTSAVSSVAFSPDGERIVSGSWDRTIRLWDACTGEVIGGPFEGHTSLIWSVAFSPDGERIVSGSNDSTICVWDVPTGEIAAGPFEGHTNPVRSVAFSPDGERIVSGSDGNRVYVWDARTGKVAAGPFEGHADSVLSVAFSPNGERIVSGSGDNRIYVWDAHTGKIAAGPFEGHTDSVTSVAFSPDGERIVSGSYDNMIRVWNARTAEVATRFFITSNQKVGNTSSNYDEVSGKPDTVMLDAKSSLISSFSDTSRLIDGWIMGQQGERLFWVPPDLRDGLLRQSNICVIGRKHKTKLDMTHFLHGKEWAKCYDEHA